MKIEDLTFEPTQEIEIKQDAFDRFVDKRPAACLLSAFAFFGLVMVLIWEAHFAGIL